jgi:hypothetical protein
MSARPQDHDVFGNTAPAHQSVPGASHRPRDTNIFDDGPVVPSKQPIKPADTDVFTDGPGYKVNRGATQPEDSNIFGRGDDASSRRPANSTGKNILDSSLDLGSGYPEPPPVGR